MGAIPRGLVSVGLKFAIPPAVAILGSGCEQRIWVLVFVAEEFN
jgi:hypothetical protein